MSALFPFDFRVVEVVKLPQIQGALTSSTTTNPISHREQGVSHCRVNKHRLAPYLTRRYFAALFNTGPDDFLSNLNNMSLLPTGESKAVGGSAPGKA